MTIYLRSYKNQDLVEELLTSANRIYLTLKNSSISLNETKEASEKELGKIKKEDNIYIFENTSKLLLINDLNVELAQLETNDIIRYNETTIIVKIYPFHIKSAYLEEDKGIQYKLSRFLTFIGKPPFSHIPAKQKNPLIPLSNYSAAIIIRDEEYYLIPINPSLVRFRMKELKIPLKLENNLQFEVGMSRFTFKEIQN